METQLGESHPNRVGLDTNPVQGRVRVRGDIGDGGRSIERQHAITNPRSGARVGHPPHEGERPSFDHHHKFFEDQRVIAFEFTRSSPGAISPFPRQDRDDLAIAANRNRDHPRRRLIAFPLQFEVALLPDPSCSGPLNNQRGTTSCPSTDVVGDVHSLVGRRANMIDDQPSTVIGLDSQEQVSET